MIALGEFHSGLVSIAGRPNVGKSTIMNSLLGEKVAITTPKPQTTRTCVRGVLTGSGYQAVFIDTPGMHSPRNKLGEYMIRQAEASLAEVDTVLYIIEPKAADGSGAVMKANGIDAGVCGKLKRLNKTAKFLVINKIDTIKKERLLRIIDIYRNLCDFTEIVPVSALKGENMGLLLEKIIEYLPQGPMYFPDDTLTDQPERVIIAELIREQALYLLEDEIPHGIAVQVMAVKERPGRSLCDVEAEIYCERDSHKGIIIGRNGAALKEIGARARAAIERLLGLQVYLRLWVKVKKNWRDTGHPEKLLVT
ncbi:MAG: GTPase Era [Clostridiales bacterium]|jgi:GTP-binding protein Era|nr:GTPase Era [Clostridiales bacterium]